jgi:class 3 adenylate cyclase/tetratricopeptide (TPR) repeat protein
VEASRQERKVVTVLFADLVGFTARAEQMDPEDVVGLLGPYHARLREKLEHFGGTVEKFIGDAVMAVFGAPLAHDDDPERAVRAALAIRDWADEEAGGLELRIAVTTGEALVSLDARPEQGEVLVAGDVVNTAARLQAAAPVNGILVGESTQLATRDAIEYRQAEAVQAKGKVAPVPVWEALRARSNFGVDVVQEGRAPLVGRVRELDLLLDAFARIRAENTSQLVTLVGVPGIGKSRLVWELFEAVERDPELIYWRQGRCLPYGEGVAFWAVGEMVKAQAGILDTDSGEEAAAKLEDMVSSTTGDDAGWVAAHLRPLIGLAEDADVSEERRVEAFAAWRRFFEGLAEQRPLVLVFEDLHWADEGLYDFVDHLVDWAGGSPMLVVCTARPELMERRPTWGGGKLNATTLVLSPLGDEDAARLVAALIGQAVLPAETQAALLARAGGNPLYAEQYVRMFVERGSAEDLPLPENVQGIIAARLDVLPIDEKAVIQDAAVLGKVFWPGALLAIGGSNPPALLHSLERKEFVRRERRSSVGGETEYAFRHMLVRDVAYGQIPRGERAQKHRRAAEWIEALSERTDDVAEMLAHHYASALEFARASGQDTGELAERARQALRAAGERALTLGAFASAARFLSAALELWPSDDPELPDLQYALGETLNWTGGLTEELVVDARDGALAQGRLGLAAKAEIRLGFYWWNRGENDLADERFEAAAKLVEQVPLSPEKGLTMHSLGVRALVAARLHESVASARAAAEMADLLGLEALRAQALITLGSARFSLGEADGIEEIERGLAAADSINSGASVIRGYKNLGDAVQRIGELERAAGLHVRGLETARRLGDVWHVRWFSSELAYDRYLQGRWDEALTLADEVIAVIEEGTPHYMESVCRNTRALIRSARGDAAGASADSERSLELGRAVADPQVILPALAVRARVLSDGGDPRRATELLDEFEAAPSFVTQSAGTAEFAFAAAVAGRAPGIFAARQEILSTPWIEAADAVCRGELERAAELYAEMGSKPDEANARRLSGGETQVRRALEFYRAVGATRYVRDAESMLAASA